jgi:hypothetical protein
MRNYGIFCSAHTRKDVPTRNYFLAQKYITDVADSGTAVEFSTKFSTY